VRAFREYRSQKYENEPKSRFFREKIAKSFAFIEKRFTFAPAFPERALEGMRENVLKNF